MINKKKILIINNGLAGDGIERASSSLKNYYSDLGHNVQVLALYQNDIVFKLNNSIKFVEPRFNRNTVGKINYVFKLIG